MEPESVNTNRDASLPPEPVAQLPLQVSMTEMQFADVVEHMAEAFLALNSTGHCTYLNQAAEQLLESDRASLMGKTVWDIFQVDATSQLYQQCYQALIEPLQLPVVFEEFYASLNRWCSIRVLPASGGLSIYLQNITERKAMETAWQKEQVNNALRENEAPLSSVFQTVPDGIIILNQRGHIIAANAAAEEILRLTRSTITERGYNDPIWSITTVDGKPYPEEELPFMQVMRTGKPVYRVEHTVAHPNGTKIILSVNASPLLNSQGAVAHVIATITDITDRKQADEERLRLMQEQTMRTLAEAAQHRSAFLAEASELLASSLDYEQTLQSVAWLAVPCFADWCGVDLLNNDGTISRVAVAHSVPEKVQLGWEVAQRFPRCLEDGYGISEVMRTGQSQIAIEITEEQLAAVPNPEYLEIIRGLGLKSCIIAPLQARGRVLGSLSFVFAESNRRYSMDDLELAEDLARRAAIAIDNACLYHTAQQVKQAAETAADRTARLQTVTAALSESLTPQQVVEVIVEQSMAVLKATAALVVLVSKDKTQLEIVKSIGYAEDLVDAWRTFSINTDVPLAEAIRTGEPVWTEKMLDRIARYPHLAPIYKRYGFESWIALPLVVENRSVGGMLLSFKKFRHLNQDDREFILALSRQCAQAIFRAQLYEAERSARAEAERANRVKDEFLAVLSHELRSPLNPILGWAKMLRMQRLQPEKVDQALATIERNAKLQAQLIEDLLDVSRMLRGKLSLNIAPVDLTNVVQGAIETVHLAATAKFIQIQTTLQPHQQTLLGDTNRLQQVLWNLLSNAIKFTPEGGRVEVRLEEVKIRHEELGIENAAGSSSSIPNSQYSSYAQITVADNGKGINPDFLPHVFEYFHQADSSTTRQFGGLGLGLAIARQIVELHGGTIQAESPGEGSGATFTVQLPLSQAVETGNTGTNERSTLSPHSPLTGLQILVVDDEADMRDLAEFILLQHGAQVMVASSATEAIAVLAQWIPDVLLCDISMPGMDGYALMRQIRARSPEAGGRIPAIALTAYAGEYDRRQALAAGFQQHISKPVEPEDLVRAIAQMANPR
jgi:PAS domain S-box-containing protein